MNENQSYDMQQSGREMKSQKVKETKGFLVSRRTQAL